MKIIEKEFNAETGLETIIEKELTNDELKERAQKELEMSEWLKMQEIAINKKARAPSQPRGLGDQRQGRQQRSRDA